MLAEKPQSVSSNGAYRLKKKYMPFSQTLLNFFENAGGVSVNVQSVFENALHFYNVL
jgi:hypothetical protein